MSSYMMIYRGYWIERFDFGATVFCRGTEHYFKTMEEAEAFIDEKEEE